MRRHKFFSTALLLTAVLIATGLFAVSQTSWAAEPLRIHDGFDHAHLMNQVEYLVDETGRLSIDEVASSGRKWRPLPGDGAKRSFGYSRATFWFRFEVENAARRAITWMLEYDYPVVDYIDFYMPAAGLHFKSGDHRPFHVRPIAFRTIVFPVHTPPGTHDCYLRLASQGSIVLPLNAWSQAAFETKKIHDLSLMWLYYGIMLALGFYNLFIFLFIRESSYLYLVLFTLAVTLFTMAHNGHAFQLLWPHATWWASICHPMMVTLGGLTVLMFTRRFLLTGVKAVNFNRMLIILMACGGVLAFTVLWVDYFYATQLSVLFAVFCALAVITTGFLQLFRRQREAVFFMLAWFVFIVGVLMISAKSYGFLPSNILTDAGHQLGSCLVVLLLSLGIGDRINAIRKEREQALSAYTESEAKYRSLVENAHDGIIVTKKAKVVYGNQAIFNMTGYTPEAIYNRSVKEFFPPKVLQEEQFFKRYQEILDGKNVSKQYETELLTKNGHSLPVIFSTTEILMDGEPAILSIITDISSLVEAQAEITRQYQQIQDQYKALESLNQELSRHKNDLENLVRERTAALETANQELKDSMAHLRKTQDQLVQAEKMASLGGLVAGVAHEINTPIGVTVTAASFLEEKTHAVQKEMDDGHLTNETLEKFLKKAGDISHTILNNLKRAAELIQGFKQVAVDQSAGSRRRFYVKAYLDEILLSLYPKFKRTRHTITVDCDEDIEIDSYPGAFSRIVTNLVMNSLIHGFDGLDSGQIRINVRQADGRLYLEYQDNGAGMPPETVDQIFEPFFTTRRSQGGTGLGMHIVYNLVTQTLGGEIACQSETGNGIDIRIMIPLEKDKDEK